LAILGSKAKGSKQPQFSHLPAIAKTLERVGNNPSNHFRIISLNLEEARLSVFKYIETFYNRERIRQTLGYKTPDQYEAENAPAIAA